MALSNDYVTKEPTRAEIDALDAPTVLQFGTPWCGHCQAAQPFVAAAFADINQHFRSLSVSLKTPFLYYN